jgi:iron complex outermembrane receptor protein
VAAFYNDYDNLNSSETSFTLEPTPAPAHVLIAQTFDNQLQGESYGLELAATWQVTPDWRLRAGYTWQKFNMELDSTSSDTTTVADREDANPEQQLQLHSHWDIRDNLELDAALYLVDSVEPRASTGRIHVPGYGRLDMRLAWRPEKNLELSLVGQNLLDDKHPEYLTADLLSTEVPRTVYGQIKYRF